MSSKSYADFREALKHPLVLKGLAVFDSLLHIGSGEVGLFATDKPLVRFGGKPVIPGSSLKGVFRSSFETMARLKGHDVCDVVVKPCEKGKWCIACGTFGGKGLASHVRFYDSLLVGDAKPEVKTGIAINRITRTVHPKRLYDYEVLVNPVFNFTAVVYSLGSNDERLSLLADLFEEAARTGLQLGGRKSVGLGHFRLKIDAVDSPVDSGLKDYATRLEERLRKAYTGG